MPRVQIRNLYGEMVDTQLLGKVALVVLEDNSASRKNKEISIAMVDTKRMVELNEKFRGVKEPTDVLAFPIGGDFISTESQLGEVVISVDQAEAQARERGHSLENELTLLTVHGILHLLGYTDEDEDKKKTMQAKEKKVLRSLGIELMNERREINEKEEE